MTRKSKSFRYVFLLVFVMVLGWGAAAQAAPAKVVNIAFTAAIGNVDPHNTPSMPGTAARAMMFDTLVRDVRDGTFEPLLAERWEPNEVGDRWRFFLRKGVQFHNGEPFDAKDVKATVDRLVEQKSRLRFAITYAKTLQGCEVIDDYTVDLIFDGPNPYCLKNWGEVCIIPDEAYAQHGDDLWNKGLMYGTGPWVFKEWSEGQFIHMTKNPNYWNKAKYDSYYDEAYIRIIMEPATVVAAHLAGDIQAVAPQGGAAKEFEPIYEQAADRIEKVVRKSGQIIYLTIQCEEGRVFHDKNARMALEYAIDRQALIDNVLDGDSERVTSIIGPSLLGFDPSLPPYEYNPEKAREYLKNSNYDGRKFTMVSFLGMKKAEDMLLAIADYLKAVGFNTDIEMNEYPVFAERRSTGNYDLFYQLTMNPSNDPSETLSMRIALPGEGHHFDHPEMQDLIAKMMREMDAKKRAEYVTRISHIIREEAAPVSAIGTVFLTFYQDWGVKGIDFFTDGGVRTTYVDYDPALIPTK